MYNDKYNISRRNFMRAASCAGMGYMTFMNTLLNLKSLNAAAISNSSVADGSGYKAIVCILQSGGNDSYNMLIPTDSSRNSDYHAIRTNMAISSGINDIYPTNTPGGETYGVHPSMGGANAAYGGVQALFNNNKLSFISNIGTLLDVTTQASYNNGSAPLPLGLYSHADQEHQWQTAIMDERTAVGWAGKISDLIGDQNTNQNISMNISLSGTNVWQTGNDTVEYAIDAINGAIGIRGYDPGNTGLLTSIRTAAIDNMISKNYSNIFEKAYVETISNSKDAYLQFQTALDSYPDFNNTTFSNTYFSESLKMIARTIAVRQQLGFQRQVFFVTDGGWDHHDELLNNQEGMLGVISDGMAEFNAALEELNVSDCVLTMTMSEFSRTLTSNGNGTDHAWGGNVMVMGGPNLINGKQIFGTFPDLDPNGNDIVNSNATVPTTSVDEYFAEIARWFGVPNSDLDTLFPQLSNFFSSNSPNNPIGFIK